MSESGKMDTLVNNAGYDFFGSLEESSLEEIKQQFETNVFGVIRTTKAVIPTMRKLSNGTIININPIGGIAGWPPFGTAYHASKFAIEGFTESLRQELADFNINIVLIEPGAISTNIVKNIKTVRVLIQTSLHTSSWYNKSFRHLRQLVVHTRLILPKWLKQY